jgi:amino acid adenylation domain-containing protein/non-ribosomal peptide synthase protein (TIGR01720 family)
MYLAKQDSVQALQQIARPVRVHTGGEHDLVGILRETEDGISGTFEIRTDIYPPEVVRHWVDAYLTLLDGLTARPEAPVRTIGCARLEIGADTEPDSARPTLSMADLVARQAAATPDAPALESADGALSYAELQAQVERLARRLVRQGVGRESLVALAMGRAAATVVCALAVARAGGAFVPIDPERPAELFLRLLADAAPVALVTDSATAKLLPRHDVPELLVDVDEPADDVALPQQPADAGAAAYVTYTSGSTGMPKGVVTTNAGIADLADSWTRQLGLRPADRVLQIGHPSFDIWVGELCAAFGAGATLVVPASSGPLAGPDLAEVMAATRVTFALLPPALLAGVSPEHCPELATVCAGADACPAELAAVWTRAGRRFFNAYGPTESTVAATISAQLSEGTTAPPIGHPTLGTRLYVLDGMLQPLPVGAPGELYLAGGNLARGYLGRPATTAERFVADPYSAEPGARMYRTGDLVRRRADGQLDFLGRTDRQFKLHGLRIEPGEIEAALCAHESVAQAVVDLHPDRGTKQLVAYLVPREQARFDPQAVLAHAARTLPRSMVPTAVVVLERLPVTSRGKLDRGALPAPATQPASAQERREPSTPREELLCGLFAEVLGVTAVGADSDFFALGGDSIMAIQLAGRARAAGLTLRPADVLISRTPAALATVVVEAVAPDETGSPGDDELATATRIALTPTMRWWLNSADEGSRARFTMAVLLPLPSGLDEGRIRHTLAMLTRRHGALRLRLVREDDADGGWAWEMAAASDAPLIELARVDASGLDEAAIREAARAVAAGISLPPEHGKMLAPVWFDAGPARAGRLLLTVHHMAVDAVSWGIIERELAELLATGSLTAPKPAASLRDWAEELERRALAAADELPFWLQALGSEGDQLAPGREVRGPRTTFTVGLDARQTDVLVNRLPADFRCTPEDVLLTALHAAAVRWRGTEGTGLRVELEGHGRSAPSSRLELSSTVGWFTCQYPVSLRAAVAAASCWEDAAHAARALKQIKDGLRAVPDTGLGYGLLRYRNPETAPTLAAIPGPQLRFNYLGRIGGAGGEAELLGVADQDAMPLTHLIELDVACVPAADGLVLASTWSYPAETFAEEEIRALAESWTRALAELAGYAREAGFGGSTVTDFPLVSLTQHDLESFEADLGSLEDTDGWGENDDKDGSI